MERMVFDLRIPTYVRHSQNTTICHPNCENQPNPNQPNNFPCMGTQMGGAVNKQLCQVGMQDTEPNQTLGVTQI